MRRLSVLGVRGLAFVLVALLSLPRAAVANDTESLRGVKSFAVLVENLSQDARDLGLSISEIQTAVELRLRLAGIKVVTTNETMDLPGSPYLYVQLSIIGKVPERISFNVELRFTQAVALKRDPNKLFLASTWTTGGVGAGGSDSVGDFIMRELGKLTDDFLNAYLSVNSK